MHLGSPSNLWLLAAVELLAVGFFLLGLWRRRAGARFAGARGASASSRAYWVRATLVVVAATLAVIAMARPQWGSREYGREQEGVDVVVALDISQSMTARDVQPSRLSAAKSEVENLIATLRGNRVGLVFFAGSSILRSPLSTDTQALTQIVYRADREPGLTRAGSDIGAALQQAGRILDASKSPGKAVVVVSDGEDFGTSASAEAQELALKGIVIFAAGAGTPEGSTMLEPAGTSGQTRTKVDAAGRPVITRLEEANLQALVGAGGGRYLRLGAIGSDLASLGDDLNRLQKAPLAEQTQRVAIERLQIFAAAALLVLALAWFVPEEMPAFYHARSSLSWLRSGPAFLLLALLVGGACATQDPLRDRNQAANRLFEQGEFEQALVAYGELLAGRPDLPELAYNAGNTLHRLGSFERAVEETRRALPPTTVTLGAATYFALGNHFLGLNDLPNAFEAFKSALLLVPNDADAKWNLEVVLLLMNDRALPPVPLPAGGQPADQPPQPGAPGVEQPGQTPTGEPSGPPSQPPSDQAPASAADIARQLEEALAGINQDFSFEDAIEVLDLLQELRDQRRTPGGQTTPSGPDY